jgi:protein BCP1
VDATWFDMLALIDLPFGSTVNVNSKATDSYAFLAALNLYEHHEKVQSNLEIETERKQRKSKEEASLFYFHPEDEVFQKHALAYGSYLYTKEDEAVANSKRAFQEMSVKTQGFIVLVNASKFRGAVSS